MIFHLPSGKMFVVSPVENLKVLRFKEFRSKIVILLHWEKISEQYRKVVLRKHGEIILYIYSVSVSSISREKVSDGILRNKKKRLVEIKIHNEYAILLWKNGPGVLWNKERKRLELSSKIPR